MIIKYQGAAGYFQKRLYPVYVLVGQDHYLLNDAALNIKKAWRQLGESDEKIIHLQNAADWNLLLEEANSYSLFAQQVLIDARFDKKTIDSAGKGVLTQYLKNINSRCLIILQANNVPAKQLSWLSNNEHVTLVQVTPLSNDALQKWIAAQLQQKAIHHVPQVPALIHQYTQGNMLACAQVIEKLALIYDEKNILTIEDVRAQLIDQCEFQLYELADACLAANSGKVLHLLRQAQHNRAEPTLILWLLTQEVRQLIQLSHLLKQALALPTACSQLKIWPQRAHLYEKTVARLPISKLHQLLQSSKQLDERIKTSQSNQIWHTLEQLALALCLKEYSVLV